MRADFVLKNVQIFDCVLHRFYPGEVAVRGDRILFAGESAYPSLSGGETIDGGGKYLIPGLIDIHLHVESSMVTPPVFSHELIRNGVTSCVAEPHEIANVFGVKGMLAFLQSAEECVADMFFGIPSSVPSSGFETTGGVIGEDEVALLLKQPGVACLGEVMDCAEMIRNSKASVHSMIRMVREAMGRSAVIEGHCPRFLGEDLLQIAYCGVDSDHTEQTPERMDQRIRAGVFVELQEKSVTPDIIAYIKAHDVYEHFCFVTDDVMPNRFVEKGHLNKVLAKAVELGLSPEAAIYAATVTPARRMHLSDRGRIQPGKLADFALVEDLSDFDMLQVYKNGKKVYDVKAAYPFVQAYAFSKELYDSLRIPPLQREDFKVSLPYDDCLVRCRAIEVQEKTTFTMEKAVEVSVREGLLQWEDSPYCLIKVFDRYTGAGGSGTGLLTGACICRGAIATTYAHDHHNLMVAGKNAEDMRIAANRVIASGGGICCVENGETLGFVPLPLGGIVSEDSMQVVGEKLSRVTEAMCRLGYRHYNPVMSFCTLGLPVSQALKITDRGLVDVSGGRIVPLVYED